MKYNMRYGSILRAFEYAVLILVALLYLLPVFGTVCASFRTDGDILRNGLYALPRPWCIDAFSTVWLEASFGTLLKNTAIVTCASVFLTLVLASLAAYALARFSFKLKAAVLIYFLAGMFFPPQVYIVPIYIMANALHLYNTYIGLTLVHVAYQLPFTILAIFGFFRAIPSALIDAARIDGAGELRILIRIVLPISSAATGALAILVFTWVWNDFFWGLSMTQGLQTQTVMIGVAQFAGRLVVNWNRQAASALIAMLPPLIMFIIFQKTFVKGVRMGAIKQ